MMENIPNWKLYVVLLINKRGSKSKLFKVCLPEAEGVVAYVLDNTKKLCS